MLKPSQLAPFIGCKADIIILTGLLNASIEITFETINQNANLVGMCTLKPILRQCSSMTHEELEKWSGGNTFGPLHAEKIIFSFKSLWGLYKFISDYGDADSINWLCENGFDPFFYIDRDLAINALL